MRSARPAVAAVAAILSLFLVIAGCGGGDDGDPIRIGVLVDCVAFNAQRELVMAATESPLLRRGARPVGALPSRGLRETRIAGRPVELVETCTVLNEYSQLVEAARLLVERERVDVVLGTEGAVEGAVLRRVAERYPDVTFVLGFTGASGATFRDPPANLFRLGPTSAQGIAGLATYAYRELGWRTAAIVADDYSAGWEYDAAFSAEFCALGGRIVHRDYTSLFLPAPMPEDVRRARAADGVAMLSVVGVIASLGQDAYIDAYGRGRADLSRRLVVGGPTFAIPANLDWRRDPTGVVLAEGVPFTSNAAGKNLEVTLESAFPGLPEGAGRNEYATRYADAAEAVVRALEASGGDLSVGQARFRAALSSLTLHGSQGPIRLDGNRQGIVTIYLGRIRRTGGAPPVVTPLREVRGVDQTLGGLLTQVPQKTTEPCVRRPLPPWAR